MASGSLEVAEAELGLELLVCMLTNPPRLNGGHEGAERCLGRQIADRHDRAASTLSAEQGSSRGTGWRARGAAGATSIIQEPNSAPRADSIAAWIGNEEGAAPA